MQFTILYLVLLLLFASGFTTFVFGITCSTSHGLDYCQYIPFNVSVGMSILGAALLTISIFGSFYWCYAQDRQESQILTLEI